MKLKKKLPRSKFLKIYASVPEKLRVDIIALVDKKPYSWNAAYVEVYGETTLGDKIIKRLEEIGMLKEDETYG